MIARSRARSVRTAIASMVGATALVIAFAAVASADAPNPTTIDVEVDEFTVTLTGEWDWPAKDAPCGPGTSTNRSAGWAVDWGDGFTGNFLQAKDRARGTGYHMGTATDNGVQVSDENGGLGDCGIAPDGDPTYGTWGPISYTYAEPGTYTACVVMYDVRYKLSGGQIVLNDTKQRVASGSNRNTDNSAEKNGIAATDPEQCLAIEFEITGTPELTLVKTADQTDYDAVDDVIDYTFSVENTGNVTLAGPVTIDDDLTDDESCPALTTVGDFDGSLDPGETIECTATYTITQDDIDAGSVTNVAFASADGTDSNEDSVTVDAVQEPELTLVKTAEQSDYSAVDDVIDYTFSVENTGNVTIPGPVTIDDDLTDDESCPDLTEIGDEDSDLDVGETVDCTATYTITQDDIDAGSVTNTATASADGNDSNEDSVTVDAVQEPELTLVKTAEQSDYVAVDDVIDYTFEVENTGNVTLAGPVTIDDDLTDDESCPALTTVGDKDSDLDVGETVECTATYTITQDDIDAGSVTNTATASADGTDSNEDSVTVDAIQEPELTLVKTAEQTEYSAVDDVIDYTFSVENTGNVVIPGPVTIDDDLTDDESCPDLTEIGDEDSDLDVGETIECTATYTITQDDIDAGSVTNTATASADGNDSNEDSVTVDAVQEPELTLVKSAEQSDYVAVGDVIDYLFEVENTGNVVIPGPVTIDDDLTDDESCPDLTEIGDEDSDLDVGEVIECTATYTITQADLNRGSVENTATASADGIESNEDSVTVEAIQEPELSLTKSADQSEYDAVGDIIDYTFTVENTGNISLAGPVTIVDDLTTNESCPAVTTVGDRDNKLDPGEVIECSASYRIHQDDIDAGSVTNVAYASADDIDSNEDSVTVDAAVAPGLRMVKAAEESEYGRIVGQIIHFTFTVTNTGNVSLAGPITIEDDLTDDESCPDLTTVGDEDEMLDPGERVVCTATYAVTAEDIDRGGITNAAFACSDDGECSDDDTVLVPQAPFLTIILDASGSIGPNSQQVMRTYNNLLTRWKSRTQIAPFTLVLFNSYAYRTRYAQRPIKSVPFLTPATFKTQGYTPLYDSVARAIRDIAALKPRGRVQVVIQTDGLDNFSAQVTKRQLAKMIAAKEKLGWNFAYEGARLSGLEAAVRTAHRSR